MITVITPTIRPELALIVDKCLSRQSHEHFEWIIVTPKEKRKEMERVIKTPHMLLEDPPKNPGDFYSLCKAWNKAYATARGELVINIQDGIWFEPDLLSRFWQHYLSEPKGIVTAVGNQYDKLDERLMPVNVMWEDPRRKHDRGTFSEVDNSEMEMAMCSIPRQALLDCGGLDEVYDQGPAVGEKEMCLRLQVMGYKLFIDELIEYRALHHGRLSKDWDEKYFSITTPLYTKHVREILDGKRELNVDCLKQYN